MDWGLGHTTRCIPVIQQLIYNECDVEIACNSQQKTLLEAEFPHLTYHDLPGYSIRYAKNRWITIGRLLFQLPKMMIRVKKEHRWLRDLIARRKVDAIISDNRFGFYAEGIPSVFITHQLAVKTGLGARADRRARQMNYEHINRFTEVWVPDNGAGHSIAGSLSKPEELPSIPVKYLGGISRFEPCSGLPPSIDLLIILSGPEPQRTIFEEILMEQLPGIQGEVVVVRALPGKTNEAKKLLPHVTSYDHLPGPELNRLVCQSKLVISRSGYTTVMDLLKTKSKSILVPTPGQAEQEYLATHLEKEQLACTMQQQGFNLVKAMAKANAFSYVPNNEDMLQYKVVINGFVRTLKEED
ncbi:MAG: glycosyl transferase family 28 [Chitinophagaceae bacterium]|nr:glycosyl transferase family 28 [Chitinophagaceae bacterium]